MRAPSPASSLVAATLALALAAPVRAELRISDLEVFLNDHEVTVHVVLLGALAEAIHEGIQSGIPVHVRFTIQLWQYNPYWRDQLLVTKVLERNLAYNVVTKEFKIASLRGEENRRKRNLLTILGFLVLVGVANVVDIGVYAPDLPIASNITIFALLNLNLIVLLLLVVLLLRNLVKLWFERRQNVIGAKFKAKLVLSFLALALAPAILIFVIASNFINKSIEGWFKPQVERPLDQALAVAQTYYSNLERTALRHAQQIGRVVDREGLLADDRRQSLAAYLVEQQDRLGLSAIPVFRAQRQE